MDIFPSVMEYLGLEFKEEWNLDGRSRIVWQDEKQECFHSEIQPVIALSGALIFDDINKIQRQCPTMEITQGRLHYRTWM